MNKIINPMSIKIGNAYRPVFCSIEIEDGVLSISGVVGPRVSGNCAGGCGQIYDELILQDEEKKIEKGWSLQMIRKLVDVWKEWHLNDLQAGCEHQRALKWDDIRIDPKELPDSTANQDERGILAMWITQKEHKKGILGKKCPTCNYEYGSAWKRRELTESVIEFLNSLPDSKKDPAWV